MDTYKFKALISKYLDHSISKEELAELFDQINVASKDELESLMDELGLENLANIQGDNSNFNKSGVFDQIKVQLNQDGNIKSIKPSIKYGTWIGIAAALLCVIGLSYYWIKSNGISEQNKISQNEIELPNQNLAQITLEDGRTISLMETSEKVLQEEGIHLLKDSTGNTIIKINPNIEENKSEMQTFISPKGATAMLILPDGSRVWLNSNSKLTYPSHFSSNVRGVALEGEGYFDVEHLNDKPFIVQANGTGIRVLGTEFNIATNNKSLKTTTTLISGSVEVNTNKNRVKLTPGNQSISQKSSHHIDVHKVDLKDVIAWKQGYFRFKDDDIETVLVKIQEWYNIEDIELMAHTSDRFTGSVVRTKKLSDLLGQLEKISNYKFKIVMGRVIVMK